MKYLKNLSIEYDPFILKIDILKIEKILEALNQKEFALESLTLAHRSIADEYE